MAIWFVNQNGKQYGPFNDQQLKSLAVNGKLKRDDLVRREDKTSWKEAQHIQGLFSEISENAPPPDLQTKAVSPHPIQKKSWIKSVLKYVAAVFLLLLFIGFLQDVGYLKSGTRSYSQDHLSLTCTSKVSQDEAEKLWKYILQTWAASNVERKFELSKRGHAYQLKMGIDDPNIVLNVPGYVPILQLVSWGVSREVFDKSPVELHLCDLDLNTSEIIPFREDSKLYNDIQTSLAFYIENPITSENGYLDFGKGKMYYTSQVTREEAGRVWGYLNRNGFFDETGVSDCQLAKTTDNNTYVFRLCVLEGQSDRDVFGNVMTQTCSLISQNVFNGAAVDIHACDSNFNTVKVFTKEN